MTDAFSPQELTEFREQFAQFDIDGDGHISPEELTQVLKNLGDKTSREEITKMIADVDKNNNGEIEFDEFLEVLARIRDGKSDLQSGFARVYAKQVKLNVVEGSTAGTQHSFSDEEKYSFSDYINVTLANDADLKDKLPIDPESMDLFKVVNDGVLLCKLINAAVPETIDERALNKKPKNKYQIGENQDIVVNSAKGIGCNVINIGCEDLTEGKPHLVLGLIWQVIRIGLLSQISLRNHPFLVRLLEPGEELADLLRLSPEEILIRWVNFHLREAGSEKRVRNFSGDIKDSEAYTVLLHQLAPNVCDTSALQESDLTKRADKVLSNAAKLDCAKFIRAHDIVRGNHKLNLAFVANLFNTHPGLDPPEEEIEGLNDLFDDENDSREERAFRMWINSLGVEPEVRLLFEDLRDGLILLQTLDKTCPGVVDWRKVNKTCSNKFKKVENCNYAVVLAKGLKFSLVGIGGTDVVDGNKKLTLAIVWQTMRFYIINMIKSLASKSQKSLGEQMSDAEMVQWANDRVKAAGHELQISSFKDQALSSGVFLVQLCAALKPSSVDLSLLQMDGSDEAKEANAKYAISVARKIGVSVFLLWEDIVEVKPKMILTFVGACMGRYA